MNDYKNYYDSEEYLNKLRKKQNIIKISGLILIVLILIYIFPRDILAGQILSDKLNDDLTIDLNNGKVIFQNNSYDKLLQTYLSEQQHEIAVCLIGEKQNNNYIITDLYEPKISSQSFTHVSSEFCSSETIILLHSHPFKHCTFSEQDIISFEKFRERNPDAIEGLMCEPDRFTFQGY
ncbi:MAG: hypothetical protein AABW84_00590 [Nanoarchaeota archaeon]